MTARLQHFPVPFLTGAPNVFTMTGTLTLDDSSAQVQVLDPNSSNRTVTIPAPISGLAGLWYLVKHAGTANTIAVSDGGTLATLTAADYVLVVCNGTTWTAFTVQAGSDGFTADVIAEATAATGVTIDGLRIQDSTIKPAAGGSAFIDLTAVATGEGIISLKDNLAVAMAVREAANPYLTFVTTDNSESVAAGKRLTTTDGVASGTVRVVGGTAYQAVSAADTLLASAGASAHVDFAQTYSIPASTLKAGSRAKIRALVRVSDASGADTLECKLYIGGTTLLTSTAVNPGATTDFHVLEFDVVARAAPGAAASCVGYGFWKTNTGGTEVSAHAMLAATNLATNGALIVKASAKWSATTASTQAILEDLYVEIA